MRTIYFLGAGASKAVMPDAPLNDALLPGALGLLKVDKPIHLTYGDQLQKNRINNVLRFIRDFYNIRDWEKQLPSIEDILSQLDYYLHDNNKVLSENYTKNKLESLKEDLLYAIFAILGYRLGYKTMGVEPMLQFIQCLDSQKDSIISLNYDLIVDNAVRNNHPKLAINYGFSPRTAYEFNDSLPIKGNYIGNEEQAITVYKPHGSLNWLYCQGCKKLDVFSGEKAVFGLYHPSQPKKCYECEEKYKSLIITPTFLKRYENEYIQNVWQLMEKDIAASHRIVFVGYSLPDADVTLRTMLCGALYQSRVNNGTPCKIVVVDKPKTGDESVPNRYQKLFGEIEYHKNGFEEYLKREFGIE